MIMFAYLSGDELHEDVLGDDGGLRVGPRTVLLAHPELGQVLPTSHRLQIVFVKHITSRLELSEFLF